MTHIDPIHLSFSAGSPQLLISVAIMNSLIIMIRIEIKIMLKMMMMMVVVVVVILKVMNLEVDGSVSVLVKNPEQLVQVLLPSCPLTKSS